MKKASPKGSPKLILAWAFYDWANSAYSLVITSAIFPIFYASLFKIKGITTIPFMGVEFKYSALINFVTSLAFLVVSFLSPLLSGIADYTGNKKIFMKIFCYLGAFSCISLYWFSLEHLYISCLFYFLGLIGFWSSLVFYNSYLPDISFKEQQDVASAKGFALGYIGSILLLVFNLSMIMFPSLYGFSGTETEMSISAMRVSFVTVGVWWILFSQISYYFLPKGNKKETNSLKPNLQNGFKELKSVLVKLNENKTLKIFLLAFFIYSTSVQTVMLIATYFGEQEIKWGSQEEKTMGLIITILVIQIIAIFGAFLITKISKKVGNIYALIITNIIWLGICIYAFFIITPLQFYIAAFVVGLVMGAIQSLSRSTYSKLLPKTKDTTSFFSFYDVAEKIGIVIGIGIYGLIDQITGSMRYSIIFLTVLFFIGILLLFKIPKKLEIKDC